MSFVQFKSQLALVFVLLGSSLPQPIQSDDADLAGQVQVQVIKTNVVSYSTSKVVLGLTLSISSKRDLTVDQIVLAGLRINGLPLYAAPVKQRLDVHKGDKTLLPDPLPVTIYLRDLDSVSPLEQAINNGYTTVDGTAYATVRVNPLAAMVLFSRHVDVAINLHEDVLPFTVPGGLAGKNAALAVLHGADAALHMISTAVTSGRNWASGFRGDVLKIYGPHVMLAYAHYDLRDRQGKTTTVQWRGVALATAPDLLLVPREALEPWKFDPDIADAIRTKRLSLNSSSYDLEFWPATAVWSKSNELPPQPPLRLSSKEFSVVKTPDRDERKVIALEDTGKTQRISVEKRDSSADLALLQIKSGRTFDALRAADNPQANEWESVALFRFRGGVRNGAVDPELIVLPAKRNGNRIELRELVDSSVFGSPIVAPEGVIGIVQNENSGVVWPEAARVLKLDKFQEKHDH